MSQIALLQLLTILTVVGLVFYVIASFVHVDDRLERIEGRLTAIEAKLEQR